MLADSGSPGQRARKTVVDLLHVKCKAKGKRIVVSSYLASLLRELTCLTGSHSVTCHSAVPVVTFPPLPQLKLVLELATSEGCKAELTWYVYGPWD